MSRHFVVTLAVVLLAAFLDVQEAQGSDDYSIQQLTSLGVYDMSVSGPAAALNAGGRAATIRSFSSPSWRREAVRWDGSSLEVVP